MGTASRSNSASTSSRYSSKGTLGRGDVAQQPLASPAAAKNSGKRANIIKFNALNPAVSLLKSKRL